MQFSMLPTRHRMYRLLAKLAGRRERIESKIATDGCCDLTADSRPHDALGTVYNGRAKSLAGTICL
jgi:hypothetical protein